MARQNYTTDPVLAALKETKDMIFLAVNRFGCHAETITHSTRRSKSVQEKMDAQRERRVELSPHSGVVALERFAIDKQSHRLESLILEIA